MFTAAKLTMLPLRQECPGHILLGKLEDNSVSLRTGLSGDQNAGLISLSLFYM